jgi:hypothetical protein
LPLTAFRPPPDALAFSTVPVQLQILPFNVVFAPFNEKRWQFKTKKVLI